VKTRPLVIGVAAASMLFAGCSPGKHPTQPEQTPVASPSTAASLGPAAAAQRDAVTAYRGMWDAFVAAGKTADPDAPDLRRYSSDQALRLIVNALYTDQQQKKVIKGDLKIDPKVTGSSPADAPTTVTILDCVDDTNWLVYKASGGLSDDTPSGKHHTTATVKRVGDGWKVSSFILKEAGTC
jgi:hypothetical protein